MEAYATDGKLNSVSHGLVGEERLTPARQISVFFQKLLHVLDIFESIQKLTHALRLGQGMEHVRGNLVRVLELYSFDGAIPHIILVCNGQIHVSAEVGKVFCKARYNQPCESVD